MTEQKKQRELYADALKCLGILLVIRGHVMLMGFGMTDTYNQVSLLMTYAFNMPIFFFLSGYFAHKESMTLDSIRTKLKGKAILLVLPALAFALYDRLFWDRPLWGLVQYGFGKYWFTVTLFCCFLLYYIVKVFCATRKVQHACLVLLSVMGIAYLALLGKWDIALLDLNHLAKYFQYFALGVFARTYPGKYDSLMKNQKLITVSTLLFFVLLVLCCQHRLPGALNGLVRDLILRYLGTYMVIAVFYNGKGWFLKDTRVNRWISFVGKYTLPIYLLQYFFLPDFSCGVVVAGMDGMTKNVIALVYSVAILGFCLVFIKLMANSRWIKTNVLGMK